MWTNAEKALLVAAILVLLAVGFVVKNAQKSTPVIETTAHEGIPLSGPAP